MNTLSPIVRAALIGFFFVLAVVGTKVVNSAPAQESIEENEKAADAPVDPIVTFCQKNSFRRYYNCTCFDEHAPAVRAAWSDQSYEHQQKQLSISRTALSRAEERISDETRPQVAEIKKKKLAAQKESIEQLSNKPAPDPMTMPHPTLFNELARAGVCRAGDTLEAEKYQQCMGYSRAGMEVDEDHCQCVGRTVAEKWTSGEIGTHSQAMSVATRQALQSCRP